MEAGAEDNALVFVEAPEHGRGVTSSALVSEEEDRVGGGAAPTQIPLGEHRIVWVGQGGVALEAISLLPEDVSARGAGVPQHVGKMLRQGDGQRPSGRGLIRGVGHPDASTECA
ncbi:hypothetical protein Cus16_2053 [Curtobacterium sp. ER1/6]|nr:hypothetical protein Cus16_2053 [Curtobacterium sp. ER1/6]